MILRRNDAISLVAFAVGAANSPRNRAVENNRDAPKAVEAPEIKAPEPVKPVEQQAPATLEMSDDVSSRFVTLLQTKGGDIKSDLRTFGKAVGISHTETRRLLHELSTAGRVRVETGRSGTRVTLLPVN